MKHERNALKAGVFMVASVVLIIAVVVAIKGVGRFLEPMQHAAVRFALTDDVGGLSPGDEVRVGGAKVGVVRSIQFVQDDQQRPAILIHFTIPRRFVLRKDAVVSVQSTVTGVSVLNFSSLGSPQSPALASGEALIGRSSALNALIESGPDIVAVVRDLRSVTMPKVHNTLDTYRQTGQSANEFILHLRGKIDPIVERYNAVADAARNAMQQVAELFGESKTDFRTTVANLRQATGTVKEKLPVVMDKADALLTRLTTAIDSATAALEDVKKTAANLNQLSQSARQLFANNRGKIEAMIASLKTTSDNLKGASSEIRHSPWRLLYKPSASEAANLSLYDTARQFAEGAGQLNEAALALRDAAASHDADPAQLQKLLDRLDKSFANFTQIEQQLWQQVRQ